MDSFWTAVVYLWLAATGAVVAFVMFSWFAAAARKEAHSRAQTSRTAATERMHHHRRVT